MASTPPPMLDSTRPRTPPAPRFGGYHDDWQPYGSRKSARIEQRKTSPRKSSPPHSKNMKTTSRDQPDELLGKPSDQSTTKKSTKRNGAMLPTPTKTPRKPATTQQVSDMEAVKRNIFPSIDEELPFQLDRKVRTNKKATGQSLESFRIEEDDQEFAIFADSCNRVPEQDESNPFYNPPEANQARSTRKTKKMVAIPGEGAVRVEEAAGRADGMLMNFRGKTYFQRFSKPANADAENPDELASDASLVHGVKPKLLFSKKQDKDELADDEEADTDVEDEIREANPLTPKRTKPTKAPGAPRLPASPPATEQTTRFQDAMKDSTPSSKKPATTQPLLTRFKKWGSVSKVGKSASAGAKRSGPPLDNEAKRARTSDA